MSTKTKSVDQILQVKARSNINNLAGLNILLFKLENLQSEFIEKNIDYRLRYDNLLFYFIVRIVAFIQTFFKNLISVIIESDEKYLHKANSIILNNRFDYETVKALYGKKISIGDSISHNLRLNNIDILYSILSKLLEINFKKEISKVSISSSFPRDNKRKKKSKIIKNIDKTSAILQKTFDLRHIICHEVSDKIVSDQIVIDKEFIEKSFDLTIHFFKATLEVVFEIIYPNSPKTTEEMRTLSYNELKKAKRGLRQSIINLKKNLTKVEFDEFSKGHKHWLEHLKSWSYLLTIGGGTLYYVISNINQKELIEERVNALMNYVNALGYKIRVRLWLFDYFLIKITY